MLNMLRGIIVKIALHGKTVYNSSEKIIKIWLQNKLKVQ